MLSPRSLANLRGVHPDLIAVARRAAELLQRSGRQFMVTEGVRTLERQRALVASGASRTMKSRHLTGDAFDFVPIVDGKPCWRWPSFWPVVEALERAARELKIEIECGARWKSFPDGPHVQRPWKAGGVQK